MSCSSNLCICALDPTNSYHFRMFLLRAFPQACLPFSAFCLNCYIPSRFPYPERKVLPYPNINLLLEWSSCSVSVLVSFLLQQFFSINHMFFQLADKELDVIEMALYGDVIRPGHQCRCKTVAEMLGHYKSKDHITACRLPYIEQFSFVWYLCWLKLNHLVPSGPLVECLNV